MGFFNYFLNHWKRILTFIIFVILIILFFIAFAEILPINNNIQVIKFFGITLQNWGTILAIFGTIFTLVWAMFEYDKRRIIAQQQRASEIADIFSSEIVEKLSLISEVLLENENFSEQIKKIDWKKLKRFDIFELKEITNCCSDKELDKFIKGVLKCISSKDVQEAYEEKLNRMYSEEERKRFSNKFTMLIQLTLNRLEFLCMNISSNAAGSQFIYQSLHQTFLQTIHILSVVMSSKNTNNVDKYFTNVIEVYNMWNKEKIKNIEKFEKTKQKIAKLEKKSQQEIKKLLHIKSKTV